MDALKGVQYSTFTAKISDMLEGFFCVGSLEYGTGIIDQNAPLQSSGPHWWNVITFGIADRCVQIAIQTYFIGQTTNILFLRKQHDNDTSDWILIK